MPGHQTHIANRRSSIADEKPARVLLVDADAFYVSVACLEDPDVAGKARLLLVGGSKRGVVLSASYETRAYGVHSGMPMAHALRLCPEAVRVGVSRTACQERSRAVRRVLERFTPIVEAASIDEFYLDMTGTEHLYRGAPLEATAREIRAVVLEEARIPVSVGGGANRLIAKLAAKRAKPHKGYTTEGVWVVPPGKEAAFLAEHDLRDIPGIGPQLQARLAAHELLTVRDALAVGLDPLSAWLGKRTAQWLHRRIRGQASTSVTAHGGRKSLGHERTFTEDLATEEALERELLRLATRVSSDLRRKRLAGRAITVKLRDYDFQTRQAGKTLPQPVQSDRSIYRAARGLLIRLRGKRNVPVRLLGIRLTQLRAEDEEPLELPLVAPIEESETDTDRDRKLALAVDRITEKYGREGILRGKEMG